MDETPKINADGFIESEDGEVFSPGTYKIMVVRDKPRKMKEKDWFMGYNAAFTKLAKDKEMRGEPRAILDYLMAVMDFENFIQVDQTYIAKELEINKANVSKAMKVLLDKKIIKKGPKAGRSNTYKLNSFYAWRGSVEKKRTAQVVDMAQARKKHRSE